MSETGLMSDAFELFMKETPHYSKACMEAVQKLDAASPLDGKTKNLAYLAVLAASGLVSGIPFHVKQLEAYDKEQP